MKSAVKLARGWAAFSLQTGLHAAAVDGPLSPLEEQASFHLADPSLVIELVASEPDVVSPVAIAWDADGRMYVAEMTDYPSGPISGRIKVLEDHDGTGRYGDPRLLADQLAFPNGVMPWRNGVLLTAAPDIWFLSDANRDGMARSRRRLLTGFAEGNQQLRVNGLFWGLDNWIYGANGRSDGEVRWVERRRNTQQTNSISIRRRDFRFRPDDEQFETVAGNSQFGTAHDDWGNRFPVFNNIPIRQVMIEERYLSRAPVLGSIENVIPITAPGDVGRVFGISPPLLMIPQPAGFFTSACGPAIYRGDQLPPSYRGDAFICEPVQNVVTRRKLAVKGSAFTAERTEMDSEFLASPDPWFHGVFTATGPDGALYIVDFYRKYIEHPHWVDENLKKTVAWRTGESHGRIWRVRSRGSDWKPAKPKLTAESSKQLVKHLAHRNGWWRDTAQRLIVERQDRSAVDDLVKMTRDASSAVARLHALYTLDGLQALAPEILIERLQDADAHLREHALLLGERRIASTARAADANARWPRLEEAMLELSDDPADRVRFQLALSLGELQTHRKLEALAMMAGRGAGDDWQSLAILTSAGTRPWLLLKELARRNDPWFRAPAAEHFLFLDRLGALVGAGPSSDFSEALGWLDDFRKSDAALVLFAGFGDGLAYRGKSVRDLPMISASASRSNTITQLVGDLARRAKETAISQAALPNLRLAAIRILGRSEGDAGGEALLKLMLPNEAGNFQSSATRALLELSDSKLTKRVFAHWSDYSRVVHRQLLAGAARSGAAAEALIEAMENKNILPVEVDAATRQALLKNKELKARAEILFNQSFPLDRAEIIRNFQPALNLAGDVKRGGELFTKTCSPCHAVEGVGGKVGPDLSGISTHTKETLLVDIFDPSRQVLPDYVNYSIVKRSGETLNGFVAGESAEAITLRRPNEADAVVERSQIKEWKAEAKSLMPDGLEQGLTVQDVADLLSFLQSPGKAALLRTVPRQ